MKITLSDAILLVVAFFIIRHFMSAPGAATPGVQPAQPMPAQPMPVQPVLAQPVPAQPVPAQPMPVQPQGAAATGQYGGIVGSGDPMVGGGAPPQGGGEQGALTQQIVKEVGGADFGVVTGLMDGVPPYPTATPIGEIVVTMSKKSDDGRNWAGIGRIYPILGTGLTAQECYQRYTPGTESPPDGCGIQWEWKQQ